MPLEKQVVSLELAKELKELGYPQESLFYWHYSYNPTTKRKNKPYLLFYPEIKGNETNISAPTVAELGIALPYFLFYNNKNLRLSTIKLRDDNWYSFYSEENSKYCEFCETESTEADCKAKMLIHLLKEKLITL